MKTFFKIFEIMCLIVISCSLIYYLLYVFRLPEKNQNDNNPTIMIMYFSSDYNKDKHPTTVVDSFTHYQVCDTMQQVFNKPKGKYPIIVKCFQYPYDLENERNPYVH